MTRRERSSRDTADAAGGRGGRHARRNALIITLTGLGITMAALTQIWASGSVNDAAVGTTILWARGNLVAPAGLGLVAVAGAGVLAALIGGRVLRKMCGIAVLLAGAAILVVSLRVGLDPAAALEGPAATATGRTGLRVEGPTGSAWPWLAAFGGLVSTAGGVLVARGGPGWSSRSGRFERGGADRAGALEAPADGGDPAGVNDWDRLSRDEDPTD